MQDQQNFDINYIQKDRNKNEWNIGLGNNVMFTSMMALSTRVYGPPPRNFVNALPFTKSYNVYNFFYKPLT